MNKPQPTYLAIDRENFRATFLNYPLRDELPADINEQLVVEFFSSK
jgi:small subunit ribosomal protein S4